MQDHGLKLVIGNKYSPESSPKHVTSTSGSFESNPVIYIDTVSRNGTEPEISSVSDKPASLLHTALISSLTSSMSLTGVNLPESPTSEATYSEKLISTYGDKVCLACPFCSQTFKSKSELEKHSKIHVNTGSQKCNICDEVFESSGILAEHKLTHCKIQQGNVCVACKMPLNVEEQFYLHSQEHGFQGAVMHCIVCRQTLSSLLELQMHGKHHFQSRSFCSYTCCVCLKSFDSDENLVSKINGSGRTYYICKPCYLGKAEFPCPQCGARYTTSSGLEEHVHSHKKSYQCIKCQESFSSEQEIQLHVATHMMTEGNIHECCICFTILDSPAKLQCHLIEHTFVNSEFKCHACGRKFKSAAEIQTHALDHGVLARKYNCSLCSQRFFFSAELENHNYVHQKSRETSLSDSDKGFLSQHLTIYPLAHPVFEEKPVSSLRGHSPVKGQSTVKFQSPAQNVKKHVEDSDLSCTKCDKSFRSVILLSEHYKMCNVASLASAVVSWTHGCPCCSENFQTLSELQNHMYKGN
ncbi:hypothetical protein DPMN_177290 [Dreissena polymorpha]|uniref:C2H2-type domain-containing protein n=1 Tax=Dreissena polymorpha TaxID=45954 RepID=A0A9D4IIV9_DREPO|nr:hypothetical protein DPMN_177290 [Dreissena polymorpha]